MPIRRIKCLNFNINQEPELLAKLNAVAPYEYIPVHHLARKILTQYLDKQIKELKITIDSSQPASVAG